MTMQALAGIGVCKRTTPPFALVPSAIGSLPQNRAWQHSEPDKTGLLRVDLRVCRDKLGSYYNRGMVEQPHGRLITYRPECESRSRNQLCRRVDVMAAPRKPRINRASRGAPLVALAFQNPGKLPKGGMAAPVACEPLIDRASRAENEVSHAGRVQCVALHEVSDFLRRGVTAPAVAASIWMVQWGHIPFAVQVLLIGMLCKHLLLI